MKTINEAINKHFNGETCEFYRALVAWMDNRNEHLNQGRSFTQLATEYAKMLHGNGY